MIKHNPVGALLAGILFILVLATAMLAFRYVRSVGEVRRLQAQATQINQFRNVATALAQDALRYSQTNPAIDPILESVGIKEPAQAEAEPGPDAGGGNQ